MVDTVVFSWQLVRSSPGRAAEYGRHLVGRRLVLSFVSVEELRFGAINGGWGERRRRELEVRLKRVAIAPYDDELMTVAAQLRADCRAAGHALQDKVHTADRWIAAVAIRYQLPLVSDDRLFMGVPSLDLITENS